VIARRAGRSVDPALGGFYQRLQARRGGLVANRALARQRAARCWRLRVQGMRDVEAGRKEYEARVAHPEPWLLQKLACQHGLVLRPKPA